MFIDIYEHKTIAFIDILGFEQALKDESKARGILDALSHVADRAKEYYKDPEREVWRGLLDTLELTAFSDSIAISGYAIFVLFAALDFSQLLIEKGFICRGAITCGKLHHKNGVLFGESFVRAHRLEKEATFPRIILDKLLPQDIDGSYSDRDSPELIKTDKDGYKYIDLIYNGVRSTGNTKGLLCNLVKNNLSQLQQSADMDAEALRIIDKYLWLQNVYGL